MAVCARHATGSHIWRAVLPIIVIVLIAFSFLLNDGLPVKRSLRRWVQARWISNPQLLAMPWYRDWLGIRKIGTSWTRCRCGSPTSRRAYGRRGFCRGNATAWPRMAHRITSDRR
jgi:hypothetical protein